MRVPENPPAALPDVVPWQNLIAIAVLSFAVAITYINSFNADWTSEARDTIRDSPRFAATHLRNLWPLLQPSSGNNSLEWERALPRFSFWADRIAWGVDNDNAYHTTNILLHWITTLLLYAVAMAILRNVWAAFFVAAIFSVHPAGADAVSNIAGRPELLGAAAVLGGLYCCIRSIDARGSRRTRWLVLLGLCQAGGLLSYEFAWTLPVILMVYHYSLGKEADRPTRLRSSLAAISLPLIGAILIFIRHSLKPALPFAETALASNPLLSLDAFHARLTALKVLGKYLCLIIWPQTLLPDYSFNQIALVRPGSYESEWWKVALTILAIALLIFVVKQAYRTSRPSFFFLVFFLIALLPGSNLLRLGPAIMSERHLYLALAGFAGAVVCTVYAIARSVIPWVAQYHWGRRGWPIFTARMTLFALYLCFGARTFARTLDWRNDQTLWSAALKDGPDNYRPHLRMAAVLAARDARELPNAIRETEVSLRIATQANWPESHLPRELLLQLGMLYRQQGEKVSNTSGSAFPATDDIAQWYRKSVATLELAAAADRAEKQRWQGKFGLVRLPAIYLQLGLVQTRLGDKTAALSAFQTLERDAPGNPDVHLTLARTYFTLNEPEQGAMVCAQALLLRTGWKEPFEVLAQSFKDDSGQNCDLATPDGSSVQVQVSCDVLQEVLKKAYVSLIENFLRLGDRESALSLRRKAVQEDKLPRDLFDQLFPESQRSP